MKLKFPIVVIDEDFRSENISGSGIRDLAEAIESEGMEVLGLTSYGDLTSFAQQAARASCFILSIDDEEFLESDHGGIEVVIESLRNFVRAVRKRNEDIPIFLYGETKTSRNIPNDISVAADEAVQSHLNLYQDPIFTNMETYISLSNVQTSHKTI